MADWPYSDPRWRPARAQTLERHHHQCQIRGERCTGRATEVDHIVPIEEGGPPFDPDNLRAACPPCNRGRGQARLAAMAKLNKQTATAPSRDW